MTEEKAEVTAKLSLFQRTLAWILRFAPAGIVVLGLVTLGIGVVRATSASAGTLVIVGAALVIAPLGDLTPET